MSDYVYFPRETSYDTTANRSVLSRYMQLRLDYVTAHGWLDARDSDADRYDLDEGTWYFVREEQACGAGGTQIAAGIRATRVPSFYDSLTWTMLGSEAGRQADIIAANLREITQANRVARKGEGCLWDLTRLVAPMDGSVPGATVLTSIYHLLGMVLYKTVVETESDPVWMFLTTPTIKRMMEMSGIPCTVLFAGRVTEGDENEAYLCLARPRRAFDRIGRSRTATHHRAFQHVLAGCSAIARHPVPEFAR